MNRSDGFVAYDYQEVDVEGRYLSYYLDGYGHFGWQVEQKGQDAGLRGRVSLRLKRDRHILNKMELTRLTRQFEAILREVAALERSRTAQAEVMGISVGVLGTALVAGSTFAVTASPPAIWLCALLGAPGLALWGAAYPLYRRKLRRRAGEVAPLVEEKLEEMYAVCEKGHRLLNGG